MQGTKLKGRYLLEQPIGKGGMGSVWIASDRKNQRRVCVKLLNPGKQNALMYQEGQALLRLKHRNIVQLLDFDFTNAQPYLVTEFIEGPSLADYIKSVGCLPEPVVVDLARQILDALVYIHQQEIFHSDLKPGNILLQLENWRLIPRLIDFNLAIVDRFDEQGDETRLGHVAGTLPYMAPEQYTGAMLTEKVDIYALGLVLIEMLTGICPIPSNPMQGMAYKSQHPRGIPVGRSLFKVSETLQEFIRGCTRFEPAARPSAAQALNFLERSFPPVRRPAVYAPLNLDLPSSIPNQPEFGGWFNGKGFVAKVSDQYHLCILSADRFGNEKGVFPIACISSWKECSSAQWGNGQDRTSGEFGVMMQRIPAAHLAGMQLQFTGQLATRNLAGWAGLWLRADLNGKSVLFNNMQDRKITGVTSWRKYVLRAVLPDRLDWLNYGVLLVGAGSLGMFDFKLDVLDDRGKPVSLNLIPDEEIRHSLLQIPMT